MIEDLLLKKIAEADPANALEQENALRELLQRFILVELARAGLFKHAEFHGGTCLRIIHGLDRSSEDLDFVLKRSDPNFRWLEFVEPVVRAGSAEGVAFELDDRSGAAAVKPAILKTESLAALPPGALPFARHPKRKIRIKLEIDTRPPAGSTFETSFITFPVLTAVTTQTLSSAFAGKLHALLCRDYVKGRDWYDFLWFVARRVRPELALLQNAVEQQGPWRGRGVTVTSEWLLTHLGQAIRAIDWKQAREDVRRFLPARRQDMLDHWNTDLFLTQRDRLAAILTEGQT